MAPSPFSHSFFTFVSCNQKAWWTQPLAPRTDRCHIASCHGLFEAFCAERRVPCSAPSLGLQTSAISASVTSDPRSRRSARFWRACTSPILAVSMLATWPELEGSNCEHAFLAPATFSANSFLTFLASSFFFSFSFFSSSRFFSFASRFSFSAAVSALFLPFDFFFFFPPFLRESLAVECLDDSSLPDHGFFKRKDIKLIN